MLAEQQQPGSSRRLSVCALTGDGQDERSEFVNDGYMMLNSKRNVAKRSGACFKGY